ncbi:MAG TPA: four helix bundle protein [Gemmataceae bacterium]
MTVGHQEKVYDLEERTYLFAARTRRFVKRMPRTIGNIEDGKQLVKSSGSVGANYIEANEALSDRDFLMRVRISRKEAKESRYWLRLIDLESKTDLESERVSLIQESEELTRILSAILRNKSQTGCAGNPKTQAPNPKPK